MSAVPEPQTPRHRNHAMITRVVCATPRRGKGLSNYSLGDRLGKGAFATVYKALHLRTAQVAAIKQVPLEKIRSVDTVMEEIELLQDLEHPNIVKYLGFMKDEVNLNIVLEYCENGSLAMILHKFGRFPENLVAQYMRQVLEGLGYLHYQGIIHRDIKGANILTTKDGVAKLADFGVAMRVVDGSEIAERPRAVGTPHWMAPEIIQLQEPSTACDIWSLGATVVELKTGQPPYGDRQDVPAMYAIAEQDPAGIIPPDCTASLKDFLTLCFEKTPNLRITATQLLKHSWIYKYGGDMRDTQAITFPERAVREWNSPSRRQRLAVPSKLNLKDGFRSPPQNKSDAIVEDNYENDFASLGIFSESSKRKVTQANQSPKSSPRLLPVTPPPKRKQLAEFVEASSTIDEYDKDFEARSQQDSDSIVKASVSDDSKTDPFLGFEELMEDGLDEKELCAQQEARELSALVVSKRFDLVIGYKRLNELAVSVPSILRTLDQERLFARSLAVVSGSQASPEAIRSFLNLVDTCICSSSNGDLVANFCIAGGLSFILRQSLVAPQLVLKILYFISNMRAGDIDNLDIYKQLALREDAIEFICSFLRPEADPDDLQRATSMLIGIFDACGSRRRTHVWYHLNSYGLFNSIMDLLHIPTVQAKKGSNALASNLYTLLVSFLKNPQELIAESVDRKAVRRLMRAYICLPPGVAHRTTILEFFRCCSTVASVLDAIQTGEVAPHLIAALRRALQDERIPQIESRMAVNCLVPTLFSYSRINRSRQREVARYGLLELLQDCIRQHPHLREFTFPIFNALVHANHEECWKALWSADALHSFIVLMSESGWQAMAIAAVAAWSQAQPSLVRPKFVPKIGVINQVLRTTDGSTYESVLSAVAALLDQNRTLAEYVPALDLFEALKLHMLEQKKGVHTTALIQSLQIIVWVLHAQQMRACDLLVKSGLFAVIEELENDKQTPVPCKKLINQITASARDR